MDPPATLLVAQPSVTGSAISMTAAVPTNADLADALTPGNVAAHIAQETLVVDHAVQLADALDAVVAITQAPANANLDDMPIPGNVIAHTAQETLIAASSSSQNSNDQNYQTAQASAANLDPNANANEHVINVTEASNGAVNDTIPDNSAQHNTGAHDLPELDVPQLSYLFFQNAPSAPAQCMPVTWVRAAITVRIFSLLEAKSAVRPQLISAMLQLLTGDIIPVIPMRGSISASGDLMPLSYVAGAIQGREDVFVMLGDENWKVVTAAQALRHYQITPVKFQAKEALAIVNGTAFSVSVGTFAFFDTHALANLSLLTTGMMVEAIKGSSMSFAEEFSHVRPARGQAHARKIIAKSIDGSVLTVHNTVDNAAGALHQDRYSVRTSPQWLGPVFEDLILVYTQLNGELSSVTDNPLVFGATASAPARILSGGNFQATVVTSAMEKVLSGLLLVGRLVFAQCSELTDSNYNNGLPPNLATQDPSHEFTTKGLDIAMAAYMSELSDICVSRVTSHMQGAEMHNQSLNSLALICARKAHEANDLLKKMLASYLWILCQAIDLRVLTYRFHREMKTVIEAEIERVFGKNLAQLPCNGPVGPATAPTEPSVQSQLVSKIQTALLDRWSTNAGLDLAERVSNAVEAGLPVLMTFMLSHTSALTMSQVAELATGLRAQLTNAYEECRTDMTRQYRFLTPPHLGTGSKVLYRFVRERLAIPMHTGTPAEGTSRPRDNIGIQVTMIYRALGDDGVFRVVDDFLAGEVIGLEV